MRPIHNRLTVAAVVVAALALLAAVARPVAAQTEPTTTSSSSTSTSVAPTTTTTIPPTTTTTAPVVTAPPATAPPATPPPETVPTTLPPAPAPVPTPPPAPVPVDTKAEDGSEEPPPVVAVPPRATPRIPTAVDQAVKRVLEEQLKAAQRAATSAMAASQAADATLAILEAEQRKLQRSFEELHSDEAAAAQRLIAQRQNMRIRAVAIYVSGPGDPVIPVGDDIHEYGRRRVLVEALHEADRRTLDQYVAAKNAAGSDVDGIVDKLEDLNGRVLAARADSEAKAAAVQNGLRGVGTATAVRPVAISGFAFPVAEPHNFISSFGFPRSGGRLHQGNDIFAPYGTPLFACERGIVTRMGTDSLGGTKLWIVGESGTSYYYAHLAAFAIGLVDGTIVEPGDVVGFVGNTGNAITTPPHLHFEIHPGGGPAVDPYPILKAADDATKLQASLQPARAASTPTFPTLPPAPVQGGTVSGAAIP
jgi:murein DD-endopeptidase MepM/ murein hydrolase activator NlpD